MQVRRALVGAALSAAVALAGAGVARAQPPDPSNCTAPGSGQASGSANEPALDQEMCTGVAEAPPVGATSGDTTTTTAVDDAATTPSTTTNSVVAQTQQQLGVQPRVGVQPQVGRQQQVGMTVAEDDAATTSKVTPVVIDVVANDTTTFAADLVIDGFSDPSHGTVAIVEGSAGGVRYTPNAGFVGVDTFDVRVCAANVVEEAEPCGISTVTVTVTDTASAAVTTSTTIADTTTTTVVAPGPSPTIAATECGDCVSPQATATTVAPGTMALTGGSWERPLGGLGVLALAVGSALLLAFAGGTFRGAIPDRGGRRYRRRRAGALHR